MATRPLIVIQTGSAKFLGMALPEWVLLLAVGVFCMIFVPDKYYSWLVVIFFFIAIAYGQLISKLEQDALKTFQNNVKIPNVVKGFYQNIIPLTEEQKNDC